MNEDNSDASEKEKLNKITKELAEIQANYDFLSRRIPAKILNEHITWLKERIENFTRQAEQEADYD